MILQLRIYLISILYILGALFMILFPPRNFEQSGAKVRKIRSADGSLMLKNYVDYNTLLSVAERFSREDPEAVRLVHLSPRTTASRSIISLELRSDVQTTKPGILIIGALDPMAWGAPNAILELTEKLLHDTNYQTPFFNDYDWYLIPMANPDGLNLTQTVRERSPVDVVAWCLNDTLRVTGRPTEWHKNVEKANRDSACPGTNINRNFAYHWQDDVTKAPEPCSQFYSGERPFSSAEAQAIRGYVDGLGSIIQLAIHLHASFKPRQEYILYPWRYTNREPSNCGTLQAIGEYAARQARLPDGRLYEVHQSSRDGRVAGTLCDYICGVVGTELVYLIKPYHQLYPNYSDISVLETYVSKSVSTSLSLVRGWRSNDKQNTLSFFGAEVDF